MQKRPGKGPRKAAVAEKGLLLLLAQAGCSAPIADRGKGRCGTNTFKDQLGRSSE